MGYSDEMKRGGRRGGEGEEGGGGEGEGKGEKNRREREKGGGRWGEGREEGIRVAILLAVSFPPPGHVISCAAHHVTFM